MAGDSRDAYHLALEAQYQRDKAELRRLREDVEDERRMARSYRRLFIEALRRCDDCPLCTARGNDPTD